MLDFEFCILVDVTEIGALEFYIVEKSTLIYISRQV